MATPLMKVSQNLQLTLKRVQITPIVPPYLPDSEAFNKRRGSAHANPIGVGFSLLLAEIRSCIVQAKVVLHGLAFMLLGWQHLN